MAALLNCCKSNKIEPSVVVPTFGAKAKGRKCTDLAFLAAFGVWWVGLICIVSIASPSSDPYSLLYGRDWRGVTCGAKASVCNREDFGDCGTCTAEGVTAEQCPNYKTKTECEGAGGGVFTLKVQDLTKPEDAAAPHLRDAEAGSCGKYVAYPRLDRDIQVGMAAGLDPIEDFNEFKYYGVCVQECPHASTFVCNYDYEAKMKNEFFLSGGKIPDKEPYKAADGSAKWNPKPGEPSYYGGSRGKFLKDCWYALLRAAAGSMSVSGTANIYEAAKDIELKHTLSGTREEANKCVEALSECFYVPFDSPSLFFRCLPQKEVKSEVSEKCIEGIEVNGVVQTDPKGGGCLKKMKTTRVVSEEATEKNILMDKFQTVTATAARYMGDLERTVTIMMIFGGLAIVMGFVWLQLLKRLAGYFVWITLVLLQFSLLFITLYCWNKAGKFKSEELSMLGDAIDAGVALNDPDADPNKTAAEDDEAAFEVYAIICTVVTTLYFVTVLLMYKKVRIAVGIIKEASKAVHTMPFIVLWPIVTVTLVLCAFGIWTVSAAVIGTSGDLLTTDRSAALATIQSPTHAPTAGSLAARLLEEDEGAVLDEGSTTPFAFSKYAADGSYNVSAAGLGMGAYKSLSAMGGRDVFQMYNLFTFLWTNQFLQGIETMTIAGAIACWYWTLDKSNRKNLAAHPITASLFRAVRYHLGTIAFGSLIIAIVQMVRIALAYLDRQTKAIQKANFAIKMMMKSVQCCLWCFEKCVKFITNSAYIVCSMYGGSFCASTKKAFKLILKNMSRVATLKLISTFLMILGKVVIAATCGFLGFLWIDHDPRFQPPDGEPLSSGLLPVIVTTLVAFCVGSAFIGVYSMAIDTIMLCFLEDMAINDGSEDKPFYADGALKRFVDNHADKVKKRRRKKGKSKGKKKKGKGKKDGDGKDKKDKKKDKKAKK